MKKPQDNPVRYLKGIGPKRAKALNKAGIYTIEDLFYYFPRRYEDRTKFTPIAKLIEGQAQTIRAVVLGKNVRTYFRRRGFSIIEVKVGDESGQIHCVWFNQPYLKEYFQSGESFILYGKVERFGKKLQMNSPEFEVISTQEDESINTGRIVPVYTLPEMMTQRNFRKMIKVIFDEYLSEISDFLPFDIRSRNNLLNLPKSILNMHFPESLEMQKEAYNRLAFEEFFVFQLPLILRKAKHTQGPGIAHKVEGDLLHDFIKSLPFQLTAAQQKATAEITLDMSRPQTMQRLLQGDVGSGKTVVANISCMMAIQGGFQAAFMVPTEILAKQHYEKICSQLMAPNFQKKQINTALLIGSIHKKVKEKIYREIKEGNVDLIIGTHALLEEAVEFKNLGLVVIDEQHKFGVSQRALLPKKGINPDILIMTATPIPRTLAITLYGDLDISIINELPPGRLPVKTWHFGKDKVPQAYSIAKEELKKNKQVYIIYPVIEESFALDIAGAKKMFNELKAGEFKEFRLGLIHGKLKQEEQSRIIKKFKHKELDMLIATTVLEVGIDIPNATCMIIEHAERFGLSQLHQLRGRVGRGKEESTCILVSDALTEEARMRLSAMVKHADGFRIAEEDLQIRGPGEFFGKRQHGLAELKIANPIAQMGLLKTAREEAIKLVSRDPHLGLKQNLGLKEKLLQRFAGYEEFIVVG